MSKDPKVIVIGLDGATWDLIKPWAEEGKLPTFRKLMKEGVWGELESTVPATTFPAWHSLFTGMNPGELGVFDFVQLDRERRKFTTNTTRSFHGTPVWDILADYGYKSVLINIPTAKVSKVNGAIVGGAFSDPTDYFYPPSLKHDLNDLSYQMYPTDLTKSYLSVGDNFEDDGLEELVKKTIVSRFQLGERLIKKFEPDFFALVVFIIDNIQHFFWNEKIVEYSWVLIDKCLGEFIDGRKDSCNIILCSDHGFTGLNKTFFISKYLEREGYLNLHRSFVDRLLKNIKQEQLIKIAKSIRVDTLLRRFIPIERLASLLGVFSDVDGRSGRFENLVDWERSKCIPLSNEIYLVCDEKERNKIKLELKERLSSLKIQGEYIIDDVVSGDEVYSGKYVSDAPDLILKPKEGVRVLESPFADTILGDGNVGRWKGKHSNYGIFLIRGPSIKPNIIKDTRIYDITPTILNIFGIPTEEKGFEGRPINEATETLVLNKKQNAERIRLRKQINRMMLEGRL